jgi:hypothetical protein
MMRLQMSLPQPRGSVLVDLRDPIQVHLLAETALSDSRDYEVLSPEEVDNLKKQIQSLTQRIEQTKANLAIQTKYRDAAISMTKLYSPSGGKRRTLLGNRISGGDSAREAELEKQASEKRCEELAAELFSLEKRLMEPQQRLLRHTAGILQLTHRASAKNQQAQRVLSNGDARLNGMPGSPESLYAYTNRNSLDAAAEGLYFDDRVLYETLDDMDSQIPSRPRQAPPLQIPLKSPVREQQNQLREETDRLREETDRLRGETDKLREENNRLLVEVEELRQIGGDRIDVISEAERKLEDSNHALRELIMKLNPTKYQDFQVPPAAGESDGGNGPEIGDIVDKQLAYLDFGLLTALDEQTLREEEGGKQAEESTAAAIQLERVEGRIANLNRLLGDLLEPKGLNSPPTRVANVDEHVSYLEEAFRAMQTELDSAGESLKSSSASRQKTDQVEVVLMGLWDIIQAGYLDIQQRKAERRQNRADKGLEADEDDMSADEAVDAHEQYSLSAFSAKVQWLYAQATSLKEQKSVLKRQIKQQRELNNKSNSEKDRELTQTTEELREVRLMLDKLEQEAQEAQEALLKAKDDLEVAQRTTAANESASASLTAAQQQLYDREAQIADMEANEEELRSRIANLEHNGEELRNELSTVEASVTFVGSQLEEALAAKNLAETRADTLQAQLKEKEEELERMNSLIIELKTEATIAKAELEGAYGSRAQRAAEAAKFTQSNENAELAMLRTELAGALKELEDLTKDTLTAEKEKLELEAQLDDITADKSNLETEIKKLRDRLHAETTRLREQLDAERLKVPPSPGGIGPQDRRAGTTMLSEQFRHSMKEERKRFRDEIKVCSTLRLQPLGECALLTMSVSQEEQARRKKLEDEVRMLRRAQGPGRSPLGPLSPRSQA